MRQDNKHWMRKLIGLLFYLKGTNSTYLAELVNCTSSILAHLPIAAYTL
jgi:hypothetical protein